MFDFLKDISDWFSWSWFLPSTLRSYHWDSPYFLYLIPIIPLLVLLRWAFYYRFRQKMDVAFPLKDLNYSWFIGKLRFIPYFFIIISIWLLLVALARPQKADETAEVFKEGIDIVLVLDISESMELEDLHPDRLSAAKNIASRFIESRKEDRIGLVVFSGDAFSLSPLTTDHQLVQSFIAELSSGMIESGGSAIGNAIGVAINRLRESQSKSKVMIVISDGENTAGNLNPLMAAKLAKAFGIKIYSIAIGREGKVAWGNDTNGKKAYVESHLDESTLRKIAQISEGRFFRASNRKALEQTFTLIDSYEKGIIRENRFKNTRDYYQVYLFWAMIIYLLWLFLKSTFISNALED
ncbi:MAG: VWA domain-containing protein [Sporocytophaga sp.]|uniref:vWA domain-containing protein n=1 Tax=Sporocytophaga sp. TaxID=2231183 RepID=UPI001B1B2020|nr:VWA domain-containing protein [Sporocytophaga sp.]MBO9700843.1 VWA domain-containing protein [Sporocytophaga sp.]